MNAAVFLTLALIAMLSPFDALTEAVIIFLPKEYITASNNVDKGNNSTKAMKAATLFLQGFKSH